MRHLNTYIPHTLILVGGLVACGGPLPEENGQDLGRDEARGPGPIDEQPPMDGAPPVDEAPPPVDEAPDLSAFIAPFDNDSLQNPAVSEFMSPTGNRELVYFDQVSALEGDGDDWIEFELPNNSNSAQRIRVELRCEFSGQASQNAQVRVTLWEDGEEDLTLRALCNDGLRELTVDNTKVQTARISFSVPPVDAQVLVDYELRILGFR
jgi:hypothetical protein